MAAKTTPKSLGAQVDRLNQQVCTLMAYIAHFEQHQKVGVEERFIEAAAKQLLREQESTKDADQIHITASYLARGQPAPSSA